VIILFGVTIQRNLRLGAEVSRQSVSEEDQHRDAVTDGYIDCGGDCGRQEGIVQGLVTAEKSSLDWVYKVFHEKNGQTQYYNGDHVQYVGDRHLDIGKDHRGITSSGWGAPAT